MKICEIREITGSGALFPREHAAFSAVDSAACPRLLKSGAPGSPAILRARGAAAGEDSHPRTMRLLESIEKQALINTLRAGLSPAEPDAQPPFKEGLQMELLDIRDHQRAERSALRLATLVYDYRDAVIIRDFKDRIVAWNRGAEQMYGYTEEEALGMSIRRLIPKTSPARARERVRLSAQGKKGAQTEARRRAKDGRTLDVLVTVTVLRDDNGQPAEIATTERDITEQKKAERELRRLHALVISAQETERRRLARELHDGVGQILSGIRFRLESLPGEITLNGKAEAKIIKVGDLLSRAISEVRRVSKNLMPSELEDLGLEPALRTLCREFRGRVGVHATLRTSGLSKAVAPELSLALFRIAQEALNNIGKHSKAALVAVDLSRKGGDILLRVSDNGVGFIPGGGRPHGGRGIGLGSMRERAESVGGSLELKSTPGAGTTLCVRAPLAGL